MREITATAANGGSRPATVVSDVLVAVQAACRGLSSDLRRRDGFQRTVQAPGTGPSL